MNGNPLFGGAMAGGGGEQSQEMVAVKSVSQFIGVVMKEQANSNTGY